MQEMNCGMPHEMQSNMYMFYHATLDRCPYQGSKASHYAKAYLSNFGLPSKPAAHKPQSPQAFNAAALIFLRMSSFDATVYFMEKEGPSWIRALNCDLEVSSASVNVFFTELSLATFFSALAFFAGRAFLAFNAVMQPPPSWLPSPPWPPPWLSPWPPPSPIWSPLMQPQLCAHQ